jgi:transposase
MKCPICKGSGLIKPPKNILNKHDLKMLKREAIYILKEQGYSYREIMKMFGYKSTRSISENLRLYNEKEQP